MKTHELKLDIKYFDDVKTGKKKFEIRKNDRDFEVGDILDLKAWDKDSFVFWRTTSSDNHEDYWQTCLKEKADTIKVKVTEVIRADEFNKNPWEYETSTKMYAADILEIDVLDVLKDYFHTDLIPDGYAVLGIEVIE